MLKKIKICAQKILENKAIKKIFESFVLATSWLGSRNRLFSYVYHVLSPISYSKEQIVALRGRYQFYQDKSKNNPSKPYIRRNIHRIEKGLLMKPRKPVFAQKYILPTVKNIEAYIEEIKPVDRDLPELLWIHNTLRVYFDVVKNGDHTVPSLVLEAERLFNEINWELILVSCEMSDSTKPSSNKPPIASKLLNEPYSHSEIPQSNIKYEELYKLGVQRRSVRWYQDKKVEKTKIDKALKFAMLSPSACNRLPYKFLVFNDREKAKKIADLPFGASGYAQNIPAIAIVTGDQQYYFSSRDRHVIYVDASLTAMSFIYALETQGISSCIIHWPDFELLEMKLQKTLNLKLSQKAIMFIAFGYADPDGLVGVSGKKDLREIAEYNREV